MIKLELDPRFGRLTPARREYVRHLYRSRRQRGDSINDARSYVNFTVDLFWSV